MTHNPFVSLLEEFRSAAATLNTTGFAFTAWWHFPQRFVNAKRRVLGLCCLPVQYGDEVQYQEFTLTVATAGEHAKCGPVFADLASRAGAALFPEIRSELAEHVPLYISQMAPWWFAFLWRVFVGSEPLQHPVCADTGKPAEESVPRPLFRPFLLSIEAIELCKLHTDQCVFPPPAGTPGHSEGNGGADDYANWITVSEAERISGTNRGVISRAADRRQIETNGERGRGRRLNAGSFIRWVIERSPPAKSIPDPETVVARARAERQKRGIIDED